ncbi:restriction endonuclease subunit S domain-containing protein [Francisella hispaniensis]|uniref:hypothetical protein n=1 Tax=Francisella hispaniensis TaxID=622488 RepID=UPI0019047AA6|nr:hypothetical protein [Francisella hispaniensis]MBK2357774.1 hypothetical protein [Francisella hispaniensis]
MSELYKLPTGWEWKKLGEVFDVKDGTHDSPKYKEIGYPLVTSKNLKNNSLDLTSCKFITYLTQKIVSFKKIFRILIIGNKCIF